MDHGGHDRRRAGQSAGNERPEDRVVVDDIDVRRVWYAANVCADSATVVPRGSADLSKYQARGTGQVDSATMNSTMS